MNKTFVLYFLKVSLLDIDDSIGNKTISYLDKKYKTSDRVLFIKCDVTNKDNFEGIKTLYFFYCI